MQNKVLFFIYQSEKNKRHCFIAKFFKQIKFKKKIKIYLLFAIF